jgi:lysophospholipase L1-like esterase
MGTTMGKETSLPRAILFRVTALCIGLVAVFAAGEIAIRILKRDIAFQPDPDLLRSLRPNVERRVYVDDTPEALERQVLPDAPVFQGMDYTNNLGLRMHDDILEKKAGEKRLLLFGDSYTEASRWPDEQRFYQVAQRILDARRRQGEHWRVVNAGIQNGAPSQYILMARRLLPLIEPDVVVVVFGGNDVADDLIFERSYGYEFDENGIPLRLKRRLELRVLQSSWLLRYVDVGVERLLARLGKHLPPADASVEVLPWGPFYCSADPASKEAFRNKTGRYLQELASMSREAGARFGVFLIHYLWSFDDEPFYYEHFPGFRASLAEWGCDRHDLAPYNHFIETYLHEVGVASYNSYDRLLREKQEHPEQKLWGYVDYHFAPKGHQVIGEELVAFLEELLVQEPPPTARH